MADKAASATVSASPAASSPEAQTTPGKKGAAASKVKKPRVKPTHPRTAEMVNAAIRSLNERGGSSLQAIKKYIVATYMVDAEKNAPFIKRYLKTAVATGILTQTKGKGASGSFKISAAKTDAPKAKGKTAAPKPTTPKKSAAPAKKPRTPKKAAAAPKKAKDASAAEKRVKTPKSPVAKSPKAKSPSKAKKVVKAPTKPKAPKPKKAVVPAAAVAPKTVKAAPKKAAASKKK